MSSTMCNNSIKNYSYCGPYGLKDVTSNKQFHRDYADAINLYAEDLDYPKEIHQSPPLKKLVTYAEKEFEKEFSEIPTHAVYAPAHINLCGENTDFNDGKILALATQLVTVIVGTCQTMSRQCKVKTLLTGLDERNYKEFCITTSGLDISNRCTWVNYMKAVIRNFSLPKEYIPGFKALIVSSIPVKCGLGSSSVLTVATYTFLEAITKVYTLNILEKSLACQQAKKICMLVSCSVEETLFSVTGSKDKVIEFDPRTLQIQEHNWNTFDIDLILINSAQNSINSSVYQKYLNQCREVAFALNLTSLRDATIPKLLIVEQLFSSTIIERVHHIINETDRVTEAVQLIKQCQWEKLGKVMWESHCSMRDNFGSSCIQIEYIMGALKNIRSVYGARIIGRGYGGVVLVLVHRHAIKEMVNALSHVAECQQYQLIKPSSGAEILYTDENDQSLWIPNEKRCDIKFNKYYLSIKSCEGYELHHETTNMIKNDSAFT